MFPNLFKSASETPTFQELAQTPSFKQALLEAAEQKRHQEQAAMIEQQEAARLRAQAGQLAIADFSNELAKYEALRTQLHEQVGQVWRSAQAYSRLTGVLPPNLPLVTFNAINVPSLVKDEWSSGFSTTRASVMAYMGSNGKAW
jgi:outer membrane protein TolC